MPDEKKNDTSDSQFIVPLWINVDLIQKALDKDGEEVKVKDVSAVPATASGDNYGSTIYRVKASLADGEQRSLLIKSLPPGETMAAWCTEWGIFSREGLLLGEVIPKMEALLEEAAPGKYPPLAPRCPLQTSDPEHSLVMEDLKVSNFQLADRKRGLGLRHSLLALRALARFHAASHALLRREPELVDSLSNMWRIANEGMRQFVEGGLQMAADACHKWPGYEEYATRLEKYKEISMRVVTDILDPKPGAFNVIAHADFWVNNMMFRYEDGQPSDHRMIDFQLSAVCSPTIDLHYFFSTSVSENVSIYYEDLLLREYYHTLKETLEVLGLEAPSFETLLSDMDSHGAYAVWGALNIIPVVKAEKAPDMEEAITGDLGSMTYLYDSPFVKKWMQRVLPEYVRKGWVPVE